MSPRQVRLVETFDAVAGPLMRLGRSLREDGEAIARSEQTKSSHDLLATDAFMQRFQQVSDLILRKLLPRLLAVLDASDTRHPLGAMLDRLDGYEVLNDVAWWIELNETRNRLIHEYAMDVEQRAAAIALAWQAAQRLQAEVVRIGEARALGARLRPGASGGVDPGEADDR